MDRLRFSAIAHRRLALCSPFSSATIDRVIEALELAPGARVLDLGCGKAELLVRIVERWGATGVGVDLSPHFLAEARDKVAARLPCGGVTLIEADVAAFTAEPGSFDLAINVGATWLQGGYRGTLRALSGLVRPGGLLLVGDGYWRREPDPEQLAAFGATRDEHASHEGNVAAGVAEGSRLLYTAASSEADWDHYEGMYWGQVERYALERPDDPEIEEMLARARMMRDSYFAWRRDVMGFAVYLFQRP